MKISVICAARPNSKWLAQFIFGYLTHTKFTTDTELLVMLSAQDTWNKDLVDYFGGISVSSGANISFFREDYHLGRAGHHVYLNELAKYALGNWIIELCEDMAFITPDWDERMLEVAARYDSRKIYTLIPRFKPWHGAMAHLVSRGYLEAAGNFAECYSVDSWINMVFEMACLDRAIDCPGIEFYDYTHDAHAQTLFNQDGIPSLDHNKIAEMPKWGEERTNLLLLRTVDKLKSRIAQGG